MRHIPLTTLLLIAALSLAGCSGSEAQATTVIGGNTSRTATAVARSANATTTSALSALPSPPSIVATVAAASPGSIVATAVAASPPPIVATAVAGSPPPIVATTVAGIPTAQASGSGPGGTNLPAGFPLPADYSLTSNLESGGQIIVVLSVSSGKDTYDFYKGALPGAGYTVTDQGAVNVPGGAFVANLTISNDTHTGTIAFTPGGPKGNSATIQMTRK